MKALLSPAYAKLSAVPKVVSETEASALLHSVIPFAFFLRVDRGASVSGTGGSKLLQINPQQLFDPEQFYLFLLDANPIKQLLYAGGMVAVVLAAVMFPLWPVKLRIGVYYLSLAMLGLIGLFFAIAFFRVIFWLITIVVAKPGIWIFPELFADVGFVSRLTSHRRNVDIDEMGFRSLNLSFRSGRGIYRPSKRASHPRRRRTRRGRHPRELLLERQSSEKRQDRKFRRLRTNE